MGVPNSGALAGDPWRLDIARDVAFREAGPSDGRAVILGPSLGTDMELYAPQVPVLVGAGFRVIRHDLRGHGQSPGSPVPFTLADMAEDVIGLADRLGIERFDFVGISISGAIGQALAADHPNRVARLVLTATAAHWPDRHEWEERAPKVRAEGTGFLAATRSGIWYSKGFAEMHPERIEAVETALMTTDRMAYAACCDAIGAFDSRSRLADIKARTLVIAGEADPATPVARAAIIASGIDQARLTVLPGAFHLMNIEEPEIFNATLLEHLRR